MKNKIWFAVMGGIWLALGGCHWPAEKPADQPQDSTYLKSLAARNKDSAKTGPAPGVNNSSYLPGSFGYDLDFLKNYDSVIVLHDGPLEKVVISPKYQAKVFTSTAEGNGGQSFGWINYKAFAAMPDPHMNAYGGENRIWLGPEGGKFSLFFPRGAKMVFDNWKTPAPFDTWPWKVTAQDERSVTLSRYMNLVNYAGTAMWMTIDRRITILNDCQIDSALGLDPDTAIKEVAFRTQNKLTNTGLTSWDEDKGAPCIWMLDMFHPSASSIIIVPYKDVSGDVAGHGRIATTNYFGEIPPDRIRYEKGCVLFKADGKSRGKLGLNPARARSVAGSYDAQNKVLTIISFDIDPSGKYLNQEWNTLKPPFSGDAVNAYNDGPLADGSQMGPFFELESVSPAAFLKKGGSVTHRHTVFHFTGNEASLDLVCKKVLGISLEEVKKAF